METIDVRDVIRRYKAGSTGREIAQELSISSKVVYRLLNGAGATRNPGRPKIIFKKGQVAQLIKRYLAGDSLKQIEDETGIPRRVLDKHFRLHDVYIRGRSDAEYLKWSKIRSAGRAAVERQCGAAWKAATGRTHSFEEHRRRAATVAARGLHKGGWEDEIAEALRLSGFELSQQTPVGRYNVDVTLNVDRIAVEVLSGSWGNSKSVDPERLEYILDQGWTLILVEINLRRKEAPDLPALCDKFHALAEMLSSHRPKRSQYGMIGRDAQSLAGRRFNLKGRSRIRGF